MRDNMSDLIQCPICGKMIKPSGCSYLDNGSPACPECVEKENEKYGTEIAKELELG